MNLPFGDETWWYVARSGGMVALALAALSVIWGLLLSSRYLEGTPKASTLLDLHKFLGLLTVVFTGVHMLGLYLDKFVDFSVADLLVPFVSSWRPLEVGLGVVAAWLLLAVQVSSSFMTRIPRRLWKWIHLTSYVMLPLGLVHGLTAGTDAGSLWFKLAAGGTVGLVTFLTAWRTLFRDPRRTAGSTS